MASDNELEIILTLQDKVTKEFKTVTDKIKQGTSDIEKETDKLGKTSDKTNKTVLEGFKAHERAGISLIRAVTRIGFIWGATFGLMIKGVLDLGKEIDTLDKLSFKLGISASELSKKFYGFDIATQEARTGVASLQNLFFSLETALLRVKLGISEVVAENDILNRQYGMMGGAISRGGLVGGAIGAMISPSMSREDAIAQIQQENMAKRAASPEGKAMLLAENDLFNQLSLSKVENTRVQFEQQVKLMEFYEVDTSRIREEFAVREAQDEEIILFNLAAERYQVEGNTTAMLGAQYQARLMQFKRTNDDERIIAAFTATEEIKYQEKIKQARLQQIASAAQGLAGLSAALTAYAGENKKYAKEAQAVALASAIVTGASVILNALETKPFLPLGLAMGVMATAMTALQISTIASQKFAEGGRPPLGIPSLIGERGPELFMPDTAGTIIPNNRLGGYFNQTSIHIEINNPQVRSDEDIDKLTEEISIRLSREAERL